MTDDLVFVDLRPGHTYRVCASAERDGLLIQERDGSVAGFFSRLGALETSRGAWQAMVRPTRLGFGVKCELLVHGRQVGSESKQLGEHRYALELTSGVRVALHTRYSGRWEIRSEAELLAQITVDDTFLRQGRPFDRADESGPAALLELERVALTDHDRDALLMFSLVVIRADMISEGGTPPQLTWPVS